MEEKIIAENTYSGKCLLCGRYLKPGDGIIELNEEDTWDLYCIHCYNTVIIGG